MSRMKQAYVLLRKSERLEYYVRRLMNILHNFNSRIKFQKRLKYVKKLYSKFIDLSATRSLRGNIVLIVIDCLRYRSMSLTGYSRRTTPFLDSFNVKLRAFTASPHTYSSVPSILTGLYPHNHGAVVGGYVKDMYLLKGYHPLRRNVVTLPEILRILNYDTIFVTTIYPVILPFKNTAITFRDLGKVYASKALDEGLKLIKRSLRRNRGFFAYIHLGDLHEPLRPPREFADFFGEVKPLPNIERWAYRRPEEQSNDNFKEYRYNRILLYDNTLRYVDTTIKDFVLRLRNEVSEPLLIVVMADHGEEFWEHADVEAKFFYHPHGEAGVAHGHNLFNEVIEVPLLLQEFNSKRLSNVAKDRLVSLVDLVPTLLDWLGLEFNEEFFDGYSLLRGIPKDRWVLSEAVAYGYEKKALIRGKYKLLYSQGDNVAWIFDLEKDPNELNPITSEDLISSMVRELKKILAKDLLRLRLRTRLVTQAKVS